MLLYFFVKAAKLNHSKIRSFHPGRDFLQDMPSIFRILLEKRLEKTENAKDKNAPSERNLTHCGWEGNKGRQTAVQEGN